MTPFTGFNAIGTANQLLGLVSQGSIMEYKTLIPGTGMNISHSNGSITFNNTGVTSVSVSLPLYVSGTTVTTNGTLLASLATQSANLLLASPIGSAGAPSFRHLDSSDFIGITGTVSSYYVLAGPTGASETTIQIY